MPVDRVLRTWPYDPAGIIAWTAGALQMPILASLGWWELLRSAAPGARAAEGHDGSDHQLTIPPPIEDEGEHALFA